MRRMISAAEIAAALKDYEPTAEQASVIEASLTPGLVVAGAGSGKTTTMAGRVVYLVVNGLVAPDEVLGLTFTRKAARELAERVRGALAAARQAFGREDDGGSPVISTYDSFAGALVRDHALRIGADPDSSLITRAAAWQIMSQIVETWEGELDVDYAPSTVTTRALDLANELRSNLLSIDSARSGILELADLAEAEREGKLVKTRHEHHALPSTLRARAMLLELVSAFEERKRALGVVEYADQVAIACQLAQSIPSIGESFRARHKAVLLDEFQDTSVAQLGLMADIFGRGYAVTAVGDPNQAIYSWRGASADSLDGFREAFSELGGEVPVYSLATSWRNDSTILDAANTLSRPLREASRVHVEPLTERPGAGTGSVTGIVTATEAQEAQEIASWITQRWSPTAGGLTAAVLLRTRRQFTPIVQALRDAGVPAEVVGLSGLLRAPEIVDLRSALTVAHDAARGDAMMRLLTNARLGLSDLEILQRWAREVAGDDEDSSSIVEAVDDPPPPGWLRGELTADARARIARIAHQLRRIRAMLAYPLVDVIARAERILGLDIEVASRAGADPTAARANLDAFAGHAASFAAGTLNPSLGGFLDWLSAADQNERGLELGATEPTDAAVQVLTVHAAKGLEWDVVAVAGLNESQFPGFDTRKREGEDRGWISKDGGLPYPLRGDRDSLPELDLEITDHGDQQVEIEEFAKRNHAHQIAEERRLAYVALTRARSDLLLSASWTPKGSIREISRFFDEVTDLAATSGGVTIAPRPEEVAESVEVFEAYPLLDPAGGRRPRLDAAVRAVESARAISLGDLLSRDLSEITRMRADLARALLHEGAERPPVAQLDRRLSASAAQRLAAHPEEYAMDLRRPMPAAPPAAASLGTSFHEWVENYFTLPAAIFEDDPGELLEDEGAATFAHLRESFLASPWSQRKPARVELDLEAEIAGYRVSCRVDAVYTEGDRVEIVDWKTGRRPTSADLIATRTFQLELYRLALARTTGIPLDAVDARLVYVADNTEIAAERLTEAQIIARLARAVR